MKKPKINFRKIARSAGILAAASGLFVLLGFVGQRQKKVPFKELLIRTEAGADTDFLDEEQIKKEILEKIKPVGKPVSSINRAMLEKIVMSNPYVKKAEVYSSVEGNLYLDLVEREPVLRIVSMHDEQFYVDREGAFMPVSETYTAPVLVASGYIFNRYAERRVQVLPPLNERMIQTLPQVFTLASALVADSFWRNNAEQIYVNASQELEVIPRIGSHRILFGDTTSLSDKLKKLNYFYREGLNKTGWNTYSVVNLKYRGQVVCTKNN